MTRKFDLECYEIYDLERYENRIYDFESYDNRICDHESYDIYKL